MSKIVQAVNAMIANHESITNVTKGVREIFFLYKEKYVWSINKVSDTYWLFFYPSKPSIDMLSSLEEQDDWEQVLYASYNDSEIGTREAKSSFSELYTLVKEKLYGIDKALDEIIADGDLF